MTKKCHFSQVFFCSHKFIIHSFNIRDTINPNIPLDYLSQDLSNELFNPLSNHFEFFMNIPTTTSPQAIKPTNLDLDVQTLFLPKKL